jgi:metal-responsive CopG/Arc/MetJ family transcriptional regulator
MGRPTTVIDAVSVTVKLPAVLLKRLDAHAAKHKLDRSAAIRSLIENGLGRRP